ncbi:hypothetical protein [Streptomyces qinzhouensis]|uniref:Uncharacterized protein n=1 Tax=Streptomyces qinzhouensis TaxID=2599401 RepID=A0A5B8JQ96_9ACTN|nr:hypothetical protein [Streptomyces qinzhouensis]QDY80050.1 hypothetical protein FQU76_29930 [Streptomyces qinzhouensis]
MSPSPQHPARDTIPVGDVELHDHYLPALPAGDYRIEVTHTLRTGPDGGAGIVGGPFLAVQRFTVRAPQVAVGTAAVVARQPPDSAEGRFAEVLPHVVLGDPLLPWERPLSGADRTTPWLALLVLTDDQIAGGTTAPARSEPTTVGAFLAADPDVLKPALSPEADIGPDDPCEVVRLPTAVFRQVVPRLDELRYLAHCRGANTGDRPVLGIEEDGLFSVVVAGRFPAAAPPGSPPEARTKNIVHLVSLEGHEPLLRPDPDFRGRTSVALLSLCRWTFWAHPDAPGHFRDLAEGLTRTPDRSRAATREEMWLRLPSPYEDADGTPEARREVARRIGAGYVPLPYRIRSGERTFGWYRGPLTPVLPPVVDRVTTADAADSLLGYDPARGSFDVSLAAAFETGRALALADSAYIQELTAFQRAARGLADTLYHRATSSHLPPDGDEGRPGTARTAFAALLDGPLLATLGTTPARPTGNWSPPAPEPAPDDPSRDLDTFLRSDAARRAITRALDEDDGLKGHLAPVVDWLGRLLLLQGVPFSCLVPDGRMLPPESLRFFHTDPNWTAALVGGALGIGARSSRDTLQDQVVAAVVRTKAAESAAAHRDASRGVPNGPADEPPAGLGPVGGLLLRSALVAGWPHLAVRAVGPDGRALPVLRMDHLSPSVLLCLFNGVPATVELAEPQEGFRFGVEDDGLIPLRRLTTPDTGPRPPLGEQLGPGVTFGVLDHLRPSADPAVRVLDLGSLLPALSAALDRAHGTALGPLGPADLALQLVRVPEAIRFDGPDGDRFPAPEGDRG